MTKQEMIRRGRLSIAECNRFIEREEARGPENRPADMQKVLDFYKCRKAEMEILMSELVFSE